MRTKLVEICHARSGDKGDNCTVGVIAWDPRVYPVLLRELTPARLTDHFGRLVRGDIVRYELPRMYALSFVLKGALDGGGARSRRIDAQGKAMGEALLRIEIELDDDLVDVVGRREPVE